MRDKVHYCLSPLLFNLIINTFIQHVKENNYSEIGYRFFAEFSPRHWFQLVDDATAISSLKRQNYNTVECIFVLGYLNQCDETYPQMSFIWYEKKLAQH